jgi:hypothetical protein
MCCIARPRERDVSLLYNVETGCGPHPASYPMSTGGLKLTTHLHLMPRPRMMELYFHLPYIFTAWYLIKYRDVTYYLTFLSQRPSF